MSLFILDTDTLTLAESNHPVVRKRLSAHHPSELALTVITVEEKLRGWYTLIRKAKKSEQLLHAYKRLAEAVDLLKPLRIIGFAPSAYQHYERIKSLKLGIKKMDLYIAAITLDQPAVLVSRNLRDFRRVPNLVVEDWTTE